jgi:Flp pilus assembly protein TadD
MAILIFSAAGCQDLTSTSAVGPTPITSENPGDSKYYPSDEPVRLGTQRFKEGNFGLAEQYFQDAVEKTPKDVTAWVGLAASYDRLARFDLADRAYATAVRLAGHTASILNNEGYSYLLRGDLKQAREKFRAALRLDPNNQTTLNNVSLLDSSSKFVVRVNPDQACPDSSCTQ